MRFILPILFICSTALGQDSLIDLKLDIDDGPKYLKKVLTEEENKALKNYDSNRPSEPVALRRDIRGAVNSNELIAYDILTVSAELIQKHRIKKVSFYAGKGKDRLIAWITFSEDAKEIERYVKHKYVPYAGDYSELCMYKEYGQVYRPSTRRLYLKNDTLKTGFLNQFIFDDQPLRPIEIKYEKYD